MTPHETRSTEPDRPLSRSFHLPLWASLTLLFGALLLGLRTALVLADDRFGSPAASDLARWHLALVLPLAYALALATSAVASVLALFTRGPLALLPGAVLFLVALSGWPVDDPHYVLDLFGGRGRTPLLQPALAALALATALLLLGRARAPARFLSRPVVLGCTALLAAAVPAAVWLFGREPATHLVREPVREILSGPPSWTVVSCPEGKPPRVGNLAPSLDIRRDAGDLPALIMPPPCEVRFDVLPEDGPVLLRANAGVDRRVKLQLAEGAKQAVVGFEISVNGQARFRVDVPAEDEEGRQRSWHPAGGSQGLPLAPGDAVALRTWLTPPDAPIKGTYDLFLGFGRLLLEREVRRRCERASAEKPNLVLVLMDTLRADELGCYGHPQKRTPVVDALAGRGVLYERAYATSSWTWPSATSILTGLPPETHGVVDDEACYLDTRLDTLAEVLVRQNLATAAFVCNPLLDPNKSFGQGFETYEYYREFRLTERIVPDVDAWLGLHGDARFFLYLHLVDPHEYDDPLPADLERVGASASSPPDGWRAARDKYRKALLRGEGLSPDGQPVPDLVAPPDHQRRIRENYSAAVCAADRALGEVLRTLELHGLTGKTVVAFTSDHGEELFDHGLLGHDQTVHQELVRVPLVLAGPGIPRGVRVATPVCNSALAWTLGARAGAQIGAGPARIDLAAPESLPSRTLFFSTEHGWWNGVHVPVRGVQEWPFALHYAPRGLPPASPAGADPGEGQVRLYDLDADPHERTDLASTRPDLARELRQRWLDHERAAMAERRGTSFEAGEATREMLRRFGYTGDDR